MNPSNLHENTADCASVIAGGRRTISGAFGGNRYEMLTGGVSFEGSPAHVPVRSSTTETDGTAAACTGAAGHRQLERDEVPEERAGRPISVHSTPNNYPTPGTLSGPALLHRGTATEPASLRRRLADGGRVGEQGTCGREEPVDCHGGFILHTHEVRGCGTVSQMSRSVG